MIDYLKFMFKFLLILYFLHRITGLPLCPFCSIRKYFKMMLLKTIIHKQGAISAYQFCCERLVKSTTSEWMSIYDELTKNYEEETETEQVSTDKKEKTDTKNGSTTSN